MPSLLMTCSEIAVAWRGNYAVRWRLLLVKPMMNGMGASIPSGTTEGERACHRHV
ncbi:hypothetical protein EDWATA_00272 [Edwardsiella tarda ATCC 23685]|uniref:Uncharacterized protein n=1 Tax=Edwardsiella tarda ATCC 23685 TaxID=500638 RepID=D4F0P4_EDWTA|nr:hypothetical protein EDWATA_00272 [Edwardsiella tarda ATCC 23685]